MGPDGGGEYEDRSAVVKPSGTGLEQLRGATSFPGDSWFTVLSCACHRFRRPLECCRTLPRFLLLCCSCYCDTVLAALEAVLAMF
eukprot:41862-Pyramimonas_sp.AAC.1